MLKKVFIIFILFLQVSTASADSACRFTLSHSSDSFEDIGGEGIFSISASNDLCAWQASSAANWLTIKYNTSGVGFGTISFKVDETTSLASRNGIISISAANVTSAAPVSFSVNQTNNLCIYRIWPINESFGGEGGSGTISAYTEGGCSWEAATNDNWITIDTKSSGTETGKITYTVMENQTAQRRVGVIFLGEKPFLIVQSPKEEACTYQLMLSSALFDSSGGDSFVEVATEDNCFWAASIDSTSSANWLSIESGQTGIGSGKVVYKVGENLNYDSREATLSIAGSNFTITQYGIKHTTAVYRFYNFKTTAHFYTAYESERDNLIQNDPGFQYEGFAFFALNDDLTNTSPVYRFLNTQSKTHVFTILEDEALTLYNTPGGKYKYEGVAFYGFKFPASNVVALYRFYKKDTDSHFYTISDKEKILVDDMELYDYEGISFYVFPTETDD
ncbi:MAG: hypothetical protein L3V56_06055 [Candidatus Magnetoovum sp. WYHC-5]|nr:hypothetical protein [Candidatus Magnetoovum sp. WYHC-5]